MANEQATDLMHWHCTSCHHEWDGRLDACDWCGAMGKPIGRHSWAANMMKLVDATVEKMSNGQ